MGIFRDDDDDRQPAPPAAAPQPGPVGPSGAPGRTVSGFQRSARGGGREGGRGGGGRRRRFGGGRATTILAGDLGQASIGRRTLGGQ